jgi:hypothetical protein
VAIVDLTIQGFQLDGVNVHDASHVVLSGLTCRGNGRAGVATVGASQVEIEGSLIGDNAVAQTLADDDARAVYRECEILDYTAPALIRGGRCRVEMSPQPPK